MVVETFSGLFGLDGIENGLTDDNGEDDEEEEGREGSHLRRNGTFLDFGLNQSGEGFNLAGSGEKTAASGEGGDDEVVEGQGEGEKKTGENAGKNLRNDDFVEGLGRRAA